MIKKTFLSEPSKMPLDVKETIRIKKGHIQIKIVEVSGKEGDFFVVIAPSIRVSGYGQTEEEANEAFAENMETFCEDLNGLSNDERDAELRKMGFSKEMFHNKNFSKAYVDENGVLQGIEPQSLKRRVLETTI